MDRSPLIGKDILLYPDNKISRNIVKAKHLLQFRHVDVLQSDWQNKNSVVDGFDCILILEYSPQTTLLSLQDDCGPYISLLKEAAEKEIPVYSPYFSIDVSPSLLDGNTLLIQKLYFQPGGNEIQKKDIHIGLASTRCDMDTGYFECLIGAALEEYDITVATFSSNPIMQLYAEHMNMSTGSKARWHSRLIFYDMPQYADFGPENLSDFVYERVDKPYNPQTVAGVILLIDSMDSVQMIQQVIDQIYEDRRQVIFVTGAGLGYWQVIYLQSKLGVPVIDMANDKVAWQIASAVVGFYSSTKNITRRFI